MYLPSFVRNTIEDIRENTKGKGICGSPQTEYLFKLSYNLIGVGSIVEIGTYTGHSLIAIAGAQKVRAEQGKPAHKVVSIDIKKQPLIDYHINMAGLEDWIELITGRSGEVAVKYDKPIEMLWVDGNHSYKGVVTDIARWTPKVVKKGLVAFHDYKIKTGVHQAIYEKLLALPWKWRVVSDREYGSIFVLKKI